MKITGVTATLFKEAPSASGWGHSALASGLGNTCCLVELTADNGLSGIGVASGWARDSLVTVAQEMLIGEDPGAATALWQRVGERLVEKGEGALQHVRATLDLAVWDLKAKSRDEPLWKTLGGSRPRANAYASWSVPDPYDEGLADWFVMMSRDHGFRGGKLPVGLDLETDLRCLATVRTALKTVTENPDLMIDAGGRWWPTEARRNIRRFESEYDLGFVQNVTQSGDFLAAKRLSDGIHAAVCVGGELTASHAFLPYFHLHAANVIEINMGYFGVTGALQLADAAYGFELPVTLSAVPGNITAHLAAAMPNFMSMEVMDPGPGEGILANDVRFVSGWGVAGDTPGLGLSIRRDLLSRSVVDAGS